MNSPSQTAPDDLIQPFRIDPFALRGRLVRLGPAIDRIHAIEPARIGSCTGDPRSRQVR